MGVSRVFQGSFKRVSSNIKGCFNGVSRVFQACFKFVSSVYQGSFKGFKEVSRMFLRAFYGYLKNHEESSLGVSSEIYECYKGKLRVFQVSFKDISNKLGRFQRYYESVSRKFKGCLMCIKSFPKKVLLLLLLYGIRQSFPSRRRACFKTCKTGDFVVKISQ